MKRSEINSIIRSARQFFADRNFHLPPWAYWAPEEWRGRYNSCTEIIDNDMGWDITDFGSDNFSKTGLVLFTIRNGNVDKGIKNYCEKIMLVREEQITPMHFHWSKSEDIINRGGGNLVLELYRADESGQLTDDRFTVTTDGMQRLCNPGSKVVLAPGESITVEPFLAHKFYGETGSGTVLVGEVSSVNNDNTDNCFIDGAGRFPDIIEDEPPLHLLVSDYPEYL